MALLHTNRSTGVRRRGPCRDRARPAFTLVEVVISLAIYSVIVGVAASSVVLITRVRAHNDGLWQSEFAGYSAIAQLTADLRTAFSVAEHSAHAVEFTVPDRDGDGADDSVRYEFSGTAGAPLLYRFKQQPTEALVPAVQAFDLAYQTVTPSSGPGANQLVTLIYHDDAPGGSLKDYALDASHPCAQYFLPAFPAGTTKWSVKRVRIMARADGNSNDGVIKVRLTTADISHKPTATILDEATLLETGLDTGYSWADLDFSAANNLDPAAGLCVVIIQTAGTDKAGVVCFEENATTMTAGTWWLTSNNAGGSWTSATQSKSMQFYVYGTYDTVPPTSRQLLTGVSISLRVGTSANTALNASVGVLNAPEVGP